MIDTLEYSEKLANLVRDDNYNKVKKGQTLKTKWRKMTLHLVEYRQLTHHYSQLLYVYRVSEIPLRPIVRCWGSVCHLLSRFHICISLLTGISLSHIKKTPIL